jgi:uncharacterized membrane protein
MAYTNPEGGTAVQVVEADQTSPAAPNRWPRLRAWRVPIGLVALSLVPALAGSVRVAQLATGVSETADNGRFVRSPVPVTVHVISVVVFSMLGAFQFAPSLRRSGRRWHRRSGRLIAVCGLVAAASGAWMTYFYDLPASDNQLLSVFRYVFAAAMAVSLLRGVQAIKSRDFARHGAWMTRAYAIGLGAGTQVFTSVTWLIPFGKPTPMVRAFLMLAGWVINLAVAERVIQMRSPGGIRSRPDRP